MKTELRHIAALIATSIWADGEYDEAEKIAVSEIAEAFELNENDLNTAIDTELAVVEQMDEDQVNTYILEHSAEIDDEEAEIILEALLQIVIIDGVLDEEEVENILSIASALGIEDARAVLMLADLVKDEPELQVNL